MARFKLGICGAGLFASRFIPLFQAHPLVDEVVLADVEIERARKMAAEFGVSRVYGSLDELCETDVDAIAIFTQRQLHGPQVVQVLDSRKHVYSAVPIAQTLDEIRDIVDKVEEKRLIYMTGETSYYYPSAIYCRDRYRRGDFGRFVYGEGQYLHDMSHFYESFRRSGGPEWKRVAGLPPMHYPTHSVSMVLSVTGARAVQVSCLGVRDDHEDGIFKKGGNLWDNPFSNETALMRTSDGGMLRINELRRVGWNGNASVLMSLYGTQSCFEEQANGQVWVTLERDEMEDLTEMLACDEIGTRSREPTAEPVGPDEFHGGLSRVHPVERLPKEFAGLSSGHLGSHQFLVDDFAKAVASGKLPPNHVWAAARYCAPGLVAHQSALLGGQLLDIPDFGDPPDGWEVLDSHEDVAA